GLAGVRGGLNAAAQVVERPDLHADHRLALRDVADRLHEVARVVIDRGRVELVDEQAGWIDAETLDKLGDEVARRAAAEELLASQRVPPRLPERERGDDERERDTRVPGPPRGPVAQQRSDPHAAKQ